ncbi:hypothetical protein JCM11641_004459 [Rhodosporidiobolus odoratus]
MTTDTADIAALPRRTINDLPGKLKKRIVELVALQNEVFEWWMAKLVHSPSRSLPEVAQILYKQTKQRHPQSLGALFRCLKEWMDFVAPFRFKLREPTSTSRQDEEAEEHLAFDMTAITEELRTPAPLHRLTLTSPLFHSSHLAFASAIGPTLRSLNLASFHTETLWTNVYRDPTFENTVFQNLRQLDIVGYAGFIIPSLQTIDRTQFPALQHLSPKLWDFEDIWDLSVFSDLVE